MKRQLTFYRVMANIVGVLLIILCLVGVPLEHAHNINPAWITEGTSLQILGKNLTMYLGIGHGYLYMIFLLSAFLLWRRAKWPTGFMIVTLLCGTIPILSFWSEHRATKRVRAEFAEELARG